MTPQEYSEQNSKGFEGDSHLLKLIKYLVEENNVETIIETGTYKGATTLQLSGMAKKVYTVEFDKDNFQESAYFLSGYDNILYYFGSSVDILPLILKKTKNKKQLLFLDAHWGENNPLLQELEIIAKSGVKPIITIHDFKVPNHPELGFDSYGGQDYEWSWIEKHIHAIYGENGFTHFYNEKAEGAMRGVVFILPKK